VIELKKIGYIVISLVIFLTFNIVDSIIIGDGYSYSFEEEKHPTKNNPHLSLPIPRVLIDDIDPARNWSYTALTYDWCTGKGEVNDPYLIENITINGENSGSCIEIRNSNVYFRIEDCTLFNSNLGIDPNFSAGIKLFNVANGKIVNINCSNNRGCGIYLYQNSNNNSILKNIMNDNGQDGITVYESSDNIVWGNIVRSNNETGISIVRSYENEISGNIANYHKGGGILLFYSYNNTVFNNKAQGNGFGLYFFESDGNFVDRNVFTNQRFGVYIFNSDNNIVINNRVCNNYPYNLYEIGTNIGNVINNTGCIQIEHSITINYPFQDEIFNETAPNFNVEISTPNLDEIWYTLNLTDEKFLFMANGTINQTAWNILPDGNVTIRFYASDIVDNIDFEQVIVKKETPHEEDEPQVLSIYGFDLVVLTSSLILIAIIMSYTKYKAKISSNL
jgi:parallel beta-helix repeat protein